MNKLKCIKDVVVSGTTVFTKGNEYSFQEFKEDGVVSSYEVTGEHGKGVWDAKDTSAHSLDKYFDTSNLRKPKKESKLLKLFKDIYKNKN
ncbi:hypothetical protein P8891_06250 [Bacillus atrophaeus]|uniref:hypothetical protein n=1 Tax=Bacillus atrophaeus TaxID=1452 RepID=UPI002281C039|nr:hypothetical protein [Bacillus atrophaeus]MCY7948019.1 hypothetical protein [Bacillus atrophaeus]MCY8098036.1 hypothetical protein [Bacillus atrophaeus]MCY9169960.1 hypothetical protein [Bacillus atrophaeus]MEC0740685.1 hypothetical protein [Bacillus atrophaeus]MEC0747051.1 hypothetical protein [Bacillus atrophaeus]